MNDSNSSASEIESCITVCQRKHPGATPKIWEIQTAYSHHGHHHWHKATVIALAQSIRTIREKNINMREYAEDRVR